MSDTVGKVIFLNGTSSAGKSSLAKFLQKKLIAPFFFMDSDEFMLKLPEKFLTDQKFMSQTYGKHMAAYHSSIAAMAKAGCNVIVDQVWADKNWVKPCAMQYEGIETVLVKVECPSDELNRREKERGDRNTGLAQSQLGVVHHHGIYDVVVNTFENTVEECANEVLIFIESKKIPRAFNMLRELTN